MQVSTVDLTYVLPVVFTTVLSVNIYLIWRRRKNSAETKTEDKHPENRVILHQTGRAPFAPSLSPFAVKLETYLRIANIPFRNVHDKKRGIKGKVPWIEYNGLVLADSQLIIEYLNTEKHVDLNEHLTHEQRAVAIAFQRMVDEHTYWLMVVNRWKYDDEKSVLKLAKWGWLKLKIAIWAMDKQTYQQGLGRHSKEEILEILNKDFQCLSNYLGDKKYMFGDVPSELDCSLFGQLSQFRWHLPIPDIKKLFKKYPNLSRYCEQVKSSFWPDWDECVTFPEKTETKLK